MTDAASGSAPKVPDYNLPQTFHTADEAKKEIDQLRASGKHAYAIAVGDKQIQVVVHRFAIAAFFSFLGTGFARLWNKEHTAVYFKDASIKSAIDTAGKQTKAAKGKAFQAQVKTDRAADKQLHAEQATKQKEAKESHEQFEVFISTSESKHAALKAIPTTIKDINALPESVLTPGFQRTIIKEIFKKADEGSRESFVTDIDTPHGIMADTNFKRLSQFARQNLVTVLPMMNKEEKERVFSGVVFTHFNNKQAKFEGSLLSQLLLQEPSLMRTLENAKDRKEIVFAHEKMNLDNLSPDYMQTLLDTHLKDDTSSLVLGSHIGELAAQEKLAEPNPSLAEPNPLIDRLARFAFKRLPQTFSKLHEDSQLDLFKLYFGSYLEGAKIYEPTGRSFNISYQQYKPFEDSIAGKMLTKSPQLINRLESEQQEKVLKSLINAEVSVRHRGPELFRTDDLNGSCATAFQREQNSKILSDQRFKEVLSSIPTSITRPEPGQEKKDPTTGKILPIEQQQLESVAKNILEVLQKVTSENPPTRELKRFYHAMYHAAQKKYGDDGALQSVASFFFIRLINKEVSTDPQVKNRQAGMAVAAILQNKAMKLDTDVKKILANYGIPP